MRKFLCKRPESEKSSENSTGMSSVESESSATIYATTGNGISEPEQTFKQLIFTRFKINNQPTMEDLPDEILINIFIRLLAKQLAQMRSVSKSWNGLLSHPSFVKSHLHHSIHNNHQQFLLGFPFFQEPLAQYSSQSSHFEPTNFLKNIPINLPKKVIGSANGLICLSKDPYSNINIWDPSLSAMSAIPPPHSVTHLFPYGDYIRFGYDPKTDDYKLVKISGIRDFEVIEWLQVEVYSTRKGSWQLITQPFPSRITRIFNIDYLCVDGHDGYLHWQTETVMKTERMILAFDLNSETFNEIPLPDSILVSIHSWHLGFLDGKLCEMTWRMDGACEVWVMEKYGVPESWSKRHVYSQFKLDGRTYPHGFTSRNELLLQDMDDRLLLYDPIANKTKSTHTTQRSKKIVEYVDSLVWI